MDEDVPLDGEDGGVGPEEEEGEEVAPHQK